MLVHVFSCHLFGEEVSGKEHIGPGPVWLKMLSKLCIVVTPSASVCQRSTASLPPARPAHCKQTAATRGAPWGAWGRQVDANHSESTGLINN